MSFLRWFGSSLDLHLHLHVLALDGVYVPGESPEAAPTFVRAPEPTPEQVRWLCDRVATRARRLLARRPCHEPAEERELPVLEVIGAAPKEPAPKWLHSRVEGWDLHASTAFEAHERVAVERFCRYALRGPLANARLARGPREQLTYRLKTPRPDGTTELVLSPMALLERLARLIPQPGRHLTRYFGVLSNAAAWRSRIIPKPLEKPAIPLLLPRRRRLAWADLLRRVFLTEVSRVRVRRDPPRHHLRRGGPRGSEDPPTPRLARCAP